MKKPILTIFIISFSFLITTCHQENSSFHIKIQKNSYGGLQGSFGKEYYDTSDFFLELNKRIHTISINRPIKIQVIGDMPIVWVLDIVNSFRSKGFKRVRLETLSILPMTSKHPKEETLHFILE